MLIKWLFVKPVEFKLSKEIKENNKPTSMIISISINTPNTWYRFTTIYKDDENGKSVADYMRWGFDEADGKNDEIIDLEKDLSKTK